MVIDYKLIKVILLKYEELPTTGGQGELHIEGYSNDQIVAHTRYLLDKGLIIADDVSTHDGLGYFPKRLTAAGNDLVKLTRDKSVVKRIGALFTIENILTIIKLAPLLRELW